MSVKDNLADGVIYTLTINDCAVTDSGDYSVKLLSKPGDKKTEFYSGSVNCLVNAEKLIIDSNWKPEIQIKEGEDLDLFVTISKACNIKDLVLLKEKNKLVNNEAVKLTIENKIIDKAEQCEIRVRINEAIPPDAGKYRLVYIEPKSKPQEEVELGATSLKVSETQYEVLDILATNKDSYLTGDDIILSIKLSKPLVDKQKNVDLKLNDKVINIKNITLTEDIAENLETVYYFKFKNGQPDLNAGEYKLKLCSKVNDVKSEFYSGAVMVKFSDSDDLNIDFTSTELTVSNKKPREGDTVAVTAKFTKPLNPKVVKVQWYLNKDKADRSQRFVFSNPSEIETCFEIKPLKRTDEAALIQAALVTVKDNKEIKRASVQLEQPIKFVSDLKTGKGKYEESEPVEMICELNKIPESLKLLRSPQTPEDIFNITLDTQKDKQTVEIDNYTVQVVQSKDKTFKVKVTNHKPDQAVDSAKFLIELNEGELTSNECSLEIKPAKLKFTEDIKALTTDLIENKNKIEISFTLSRKDLKPEDIKADVQLVLKRGRSKEDTFTSSVFEVTVSPEQLSTETTTFLLTMKDFASESDSGEYYLKLKSSGERSPNTVMLNVENSNFFLLELPEMLEVYEGEMIKLAVKCTKIVSEFTWTKNGEKLVVKEDKYKKDKLSYLFEVKQAKESDAGDYVFSCEHGKASCKCTVTVKVKPEKLVKSLGDLVKVKEGETINLKVTYDKPVAEKDLQLFLNDAPFVPSDHGDLAEVKLNKNEFTVQIKNAQATRDEGIYKLVSKNTETECQVVVEEKPLKFTSELANCRLKVLPLVFYSSEQTAKTGGFLSSYPNTGHFECTLSHSCTEVQWYINDTVIDEAIKDSKRYEVSHVLGKSHSLTIKDCAVIDTDSIVEIRLKKSGKKSHGTLKVEQLAMDTFIKCNRGLQDVCVQEGQTGVFECEVVVNPVLSQLNFEVLVKWQKDGSDLPEVEKYEYLEETDIQNNLKTQLQVLKSKEKEDGGEYSVQFYVQDENKSKIDLLTSLGQLKFKTAEVKVLEDLPATLTIKKGDGFELECELSQPELKVTWTKDGKEIKKGKDVEITSYVRSEGHYAYGIKLKEPSDAKEGTKYRLTIGDVYTECRIVLADAKLGIKTPLVSPVTVKEKEKATLFTEYTASIANTLTTQVEWYKAGKRLHFSSKSTKYQLQLVEAKCTLTINECSKDDEGPYEVRVIIGNNEPLVQDTLVKVTEGNVTVIEGLKDVTVEEGDTAKLSFTPSKACMCQWYRVSEDPKKLVKTLTVKSLSDTSKFEKMFADDRVVFSCKAENTFGMTVHDVQVSESSYYLAHLTVESAEAPIEPLVVTYSKLNVKQQSVDFVMKLPDTLTVNESEKLSLKCVLSKNLSPNIISRIKLYKDKEQIFFSTIEAKTKYQLIDSENGQLAICIEQAKVEDAGVYTLKLDKLETKCTVKVIADKRQTKTAPKIIKDLETKPVEYLTTEPFALAVTVQGEDLKVEWFHDGKRVVPITDQLEIVPGTDMTAEIKLNFCTPFTSDSGKYYCKISNSKGSVTTKTIPIKVKEKPDETADNDDSRFHMKPRFIEYFSDVFMEPNSDAQFKCKIIGKPEPKIVWSCDCSKITANDKFELLRDGEHYTLVIRNVTAKDEGEYTCKATNSKGEATWSANLNLNETSKKTSSSGKQIAPNFLRKMKDSTVSEGHTAEFDCFIDGEPFPSITWYKDNAPIDTSNSNKYVVKIDSDGGKVSFTILDSDKDKDEGEYAVKIQNSAGMSQCSAYLVVESCQDDINKNKRKVRFSSPKDTDVFLIPLSTNQMPKPPGEPIITDYNTVNLLLKWSASPSDINNYDKSDRDLDSQSNCTYVIEYRTSKTYSWSVFASNIKTLQTFVDNLYPGLIYSFRIRAENSTGISEASPVVTTKALKDDNETPQVTQMPLLTRSKVQVGKKPTILGEAKDVRYYIEGHTAEIAIDVNGFPSPTVRWTRFDKDLVSDEATYNIYKDSYNVHHLDIPNASEKDEGLYRIIAANEHGECVHEFYLQQADPPVFLEPFKNVTVENHQDVEMICKVDGIPYPEIKFYKDWHLLAESYRIKIKHVEPDTWIITIKGAIVRDSGLYTCTAKNIAGGTLCSCNLNVADSLLNLPHPDLKTDLITFKRKMFEEDYEIIEEISQSLNSKIYRVIERRTAKEYLAKVAGTRQEFSEWIKTEAECLNQLHHLSTPCVTRMHDAYETPSKRFILIFDEVKGKNLIEYMLSDHQSNHLEEHRVAQLIRNLLECVSHLHERNIVHLDINPDNILVDNSSRQVKLIGFTHSKCLKPDVFTNSPKETIYHDYGQPEYVAPEIILNRPVTLNTDMWSIGVIAYQLLSGKSPFFGNNMKDTLENIINCDWEKISEELNEMSHDAKNFIQQLFLAEPKDRLTAVQALNHPWIRSATQINSSVKLSKESLVQLHSRRVWLNQTMHKQPWLKTQRVSTLLDSIEYADTGISSGSMDSVTNRHIFEETSIVTTGSENRKKKITRFCSFDDEVVSSRPIDSEDEELGPGTYLLPVRDPLFTVRVREYKRSRYEKLKSQVQESRDSPARTEISAASLRELSQISTVRTVKERYHIDVYGRCIQRGSLSRLSCSNLRSSQSMQRSQSRAGSVASDILERPFKHFLDYRDDKRYITGEGSAPLIREKLKDTFLIVGSIVTLRCRIEGNPTPRCFWYHNDRLIIGDDDRFKFAQTEDGVISLSITKARVSDIGVYRCAARNRFGVSITNAKLTVGDTPDRPTRPIVSQHTSDQVYLIWESPNFNGNSDILCYKVDYKISGDVKWSNALFTIEECCIIKNLHPETTYRFRVSCINTIGVSSYSWASEEVTMLPPGQSKITIDHEQAEKLLHNQYNLEKRSQQLILVKKLDEKLKDTKYKHSSDTFKLQQSTPNDLYSVENRTYRFGDLRMHTATEKTHSTKRIIKYDTRMNQNEIKILRELREQDRLVQLIEGFTFTDSDTKKSTFAFVYAYAVPCADFITIKHKYSEELVVKILRQLLDAVQWLHLHGFVHLNIHPLTILNTNLTQVNIKLGGLENAKQLSELDESNSRSSGSVHDSIIQPIEFSAPEVINKEPLSMATDIWNIGVFTALLLSGTSPFYEHTDSETTKANISFCRLTFDEFYDDVTGEAVLFIQQCLKRSPGNRLTLQQCIDHKLFNLSVTNSRKRENILFLTEKLKSFSHEFTQRLQS